MSTEQSPIKKYRGSCHCGAFTYEVEVPEITSTTICTCSICRKRGYKCLELEKPLVVIRDEGKLASYSFGSKTFDHQFCSVCGTTVLAKSKDESDPRVGINVQTIHGLDIWSLKLGSYDGWSLDPPYVPATFTGPEPNPAGFEAGRVYHGSCHCGAVTLAVKVLGSLEDGTYKGPVLTCNCSFCRQGGYVYIYPSASQLSIQGGGDNLFYYTLGYHVWRKAFCRTCGTHVFCDANPDLTEAEVAALPEFVRNFRAAHLDGRPLNTGVLDGVDPAKLNPMKTDGWAREPKYVCP
ncbi:hypothetical protein VTJ49DRAFT_1962 [Mycothermus thermophilus]|uniref:CENP-V/GFA domain-containing protein n=1 Tax=Humicola insolens TaxID=85995 RepID=A0ABR3VN73_HUMIN